MVEGHPDCTGVDGRAFESTGRSDRTDELSRFIVEHDRRHPGMATAAPRSRPALALVRRRASRFDRTSNRRGRRTDGALPREFRFLVRRRFDSLPRRSVGFRDSLLQCFERHGCPLFDPRPDVPRATRAGTTHARLARISGSAARTPPSTLACGMPGDGDACYFPRDLGKGSYGGDVHCLQRFLARKGYLLEEPTGYYGERTATAARRWQARPYLERPSDPPHAPSPLDSSPSTPLRRRPGCHSRLRSRFPPAFAPAEGQRRG